MTILKICAASAIAFAAVWRRALVGNPQAAIDEARQLWFTHKERSEHARQILAGMIDEA